MVSRRKLMAVALAVSPVLWLSPLEQRIRAERVELKYGGAPMSLKLRDRIGQGMAIGLLAGFRGVVADFLWIQNHVFWENREWLRMYRNMTTVTVLQPHAVLFWEHSAWHMAWNIGYAVRIDSANRNQAQGLKRDWEWRRSARDFLAEGIRNNPQRWQLYFQMGWLHLRKLEDSCGAADYFRQAAEFDDAPSYTARECAHALEKCGKPQAAYEYWKNIWNNGNIRRFHDTIDMRGTAQREITRLEGELKIPAAQRIFPPTTSS